jgi:hypothetical protein
VFYAHASNNEAIVSILLYFRTQSEHITNQFVVYILTALLLTGFERWSMLQKQQRVGAQTIFFENESREKLLPF